jgi:hypothetical protein
MTKRKPNPQRGGRKRTGNERHTVSLPPEQWAYIDVQPGKNRSERLAYVVQREKEQEEQLRVVDNIVLGNISVDWTGVT